MEIIGKNITQNDQTVYINYKNERYYIESDFFSFASTYTLEEAKMMLDAIGGYNSNQARDVCRWVKKENDRIQPLFSMRGMEWETPQMRFNYVVKCACQRMDGFRPLKNKWVPKIN